MVRTSHSCRSRNAKTSSGNCPTPIQPRRPVLLRARRFTRAPFCSPAHPLPGRTAPCTSLAGARRAHIPRRVRKPPRRRGALAIERWLRRIRERSAGDDRFRLRCLRRYHRLHRSRVHKHRGDWTNAYTLERGPARPLRLHASSLRRQQPCGARLVRRSAQATRRRRALASFMTLFPSCMPGTVWRWGTWSSGIGRDKEGGSQGRCACRWTRM